MAHGRKGRKRATPCPKSGRGNVDETRDCLHGQLLALCRMFLEAFIGARVRHRHRNNRVFGSPLHKGDDAHQAWQVTSPAGPPFSSVSHLGIFCAVDTAPIGRLL
ncbi:hypothetical protein TcCL_NonESM12358 [Trypanosoma cruzi]|nr:hypothetical protein TcCL_NonESM12358 [Trypanosoma cruzi]